jgi:hypothetical protein
MTSFIRIARCPRVGLKVDQSGFRDARASVNFGLSADTAAPDSTATEYIRGESFVQHASKVQYDPGPPLHHDPGRG